MPKENNETREQAQAKSSLADALRAAIVKIEEIPPNCANTLAGNAKCLAHLSDAMMLRRVLRENGEREPAPFTGELKS